MQADKFLIFLLIPFFSLSCSMDYDDIEFTEELGDNIPDNVIENFSYTSVENGNVVFRLYSQKAENYSKKNKTILNNIVFREYNSKNEIVTEGTAEQGLLHTDTDNTELTGSLIIYSTENETEITAEYLFWNDSEKTLRGSENGEVKLLKDSGTLITGIGFSGDMKTKIFNFERNVKGIYHYDEN